METNRIFPCARWRRVRIGYARPIRFGCDMEGVLITRPIYTEPLPLCNVREKQSRVCLPLYCAATVAYSIPSAGVHRRSGEQVSGTVVLVKSCIGRGRIRFLGSAPRDCSLFVHHGSSSSSIGCGSPSSTSSAASCSCCAKSYYSAQPSVQVHYV